MSVHLVTFSGPEGAGKSTQAQCAEAMLQKAGLRVRQVPFIRLGISTMILSVLEFLRLKKVTPRRYDEHAEGAGVVEHERDDAPSGTSPNSIDGRGVWKMLSLHIDIMLFRAYLLHSRLRRDDVLICDRYFWDKMSRMSSRRSLGYRLAGRMCPKPALSFVLAVDPEAGVDRRGGASEAYFRTVWAGYERLLDDYPQLTFVPPGSLPEMSEQVRQAIQDRLAPIWPSKTPGG